MSSRILGMGDTVGLIEKIEANYNRNELKKMAKKEFREQFDLNDFYEQLKRLKNMGSMEKIFEMLPIQNLGFAKKLNQDMGNGEKELSKVEAMICSMTKQERAEPEIVNGSRRKRIAKGSGTNVSDVNKLLKQFYNMKKFLKQGPNKKSMDSFFR
jgi:signal recognition particle subunit SRP54